jgi:hypothetical protein
MTTHTPLRLQFYECDEYPLHHAENARLIGQDSLCYGILFGGFNGSYPQVKAMQVGPTARKERPCEKIR